jgi:hypothetical protein
MQGKGRERVPEIVDAAGRLDADRDLGWLPGSVSEVVEVEVAAPLGWEDQI